MNTFYTNQARNSRGMIEGGVRDRGAEKEGNEHGVE